MPRTEPASLSWWRLAAFALLFFGLQWAYGQSRGSLLERWVIEWGTVGPAVALLGWLWPGLAARAAGSRITAEGVSLNVLNGCEGTDLAFLLLAGMLLAPIAWRARLLGLGVGILLVFVLNQLRVLVLLHALRIDPLWFERLHGAVAPLVLVLVLGLFFAGWIERHRTPSARPSTSRPGP